MTLWVSLSLLSLAAAFLVALPFLRNSGGVAPADAAVALAREQIKELDADIDRGLIGKDEAALARAEIERRLLSIAKQGELQVKETSDRARVIGIGISVGWVVVGSAVLYSFIGRPDLPSARFTANVPEARQVVSEAAPQPEQQEVESVDSMIDDLAARLAETPDDVEGWRMLGWSYFNTGNYVKSAEAYGKAVELDATDPVILSIYGEALVRAGGGEVTDAALDVFHRALALDPVDPRARFFQGMALDQQGNPEGAIRLWAEILNTAPGDAEWAPGLRGRIEELAGRTDFDLSALDGWNEAPATLLPETPRGPSQADVEAAASMNSDDRQAMILGMVEGLAAKLENNPDDPEGWSKLIRSYVVLKDSLAAKAALDRAEVALGSDSTSYGTVAAAAAELGIR